MEIPFDCDLRPVSSDGTGDKSKIKRSRETTVTGTERHGPVSVTIRKRNRSSWASRRLGRTGPQNEAIASPSARHHARWFAWTKIELSSHGKRRAAHAKLSQLS